MFSFIPCKPYQNGEGFGRPEIKIDGFVNPRLKQGFKFHRPGLDLSIDEIGNLWRTVREQVIKQDLALGVFATLPAEASR
jgi:hypothetical protein